MADKKKKPIKPRRLTVPVAKQSAPAAARKHIGGLGRGLDALISRENVREAAGTGARFDIDEARANTGAGGAAAQAAPKTTSPKIAPSLGAAVSAAKAAAGVAAKSAAIGAANNAANNAAMRDAAEAAAEAAAVALAAGGARRSVITVPIASITPSPWQPRHEFDEAALGDLAKSITVHGIIQPLVCRAVPATESDADGSAYEIIAGERRLRAAELAGLVEVPIIILEAEDRNAAELALVENLQREDLNVIEEAEAYKLLSESFELTQEEISARVGKARASVANAMRLLELPDEVKQLLGAGALSAGHAKLILGVEGDLERIRFASEAVKGGLTVRMLEQKISRAKDAPAQPKSAVPDIPVDYQAMLLDKLTRKFGTSVRLAPSVRYANGRRGRGRVEIDFMDNSDLDRLLGLLGIDVNEI